jgi:hypothetical protein
MTKIIETSIDEFVKKVEPVHAFRMSNIATPTIASIVEERCAIYSGQIVRNARDIPDFYLSTTMILRGLLTHAAEYGGRFVVNYHVGAKGVAISYNDSSALFRSPDLARNLETSDHPGLIIVRVFADEICADRSKSMIGLVKYAELDVAMPKKAEVSAVSAV